MRMLIAITALLTVFTGCVTINKIYPVTKTDTVYINRAFPFDRGIDPGFWYNPNPSPRGEPYQPFFRTPAVNDTSTGLKFMHLDTIYRTTSDTGIYAPKWIVTNGDTLRSIKSK